ncbi:glycosyltransferase family 2 protein [Tellurirhabdus rosea]|uniref:glycosyltransferase family 2 protein n=1 Tax=Tellurirhabdus rosea TaxID=2674997 RepID=UPI0022539D6D|nr:glycosyltransferase family 2 protein [Tellurirhabdus rosea]
MEELAVVILNYNGRAFLEQFLPSVLAHSSGHAVYVADNASTDDSVALLEKRFPEVRLIRLAQNEGYAGGYNRALAGVEARYFLLLNSDVEVTANWLAPLLDLMRRHPGAAACQPKIRSFHQKEQFEYAGAAGGYIDPLGYPFCRGRIFDTVEPDRGQYDDERRIFWATGACMLVRADVFRQLGGFEAAFFAHMEEIDLCWRLQNAGHEIWYCPRATVYHVGGGTLPKSNPRKTFLNFRNSLAMLYRNLPAGRVFPTIFGRLVLDGISGVQFLVQGRWRETLAILQAHFAFYGWIINKTITRPDPKPAPLPEQVYPQSIVWSYFVQAKKTFDQLKRS